MRHLVRVICCLSLCLLLMPGCSPKKKAVAIPKAPPRSDGPVERKPLQMGGVPAPPPAGEETEGEGEGSDVADAGDAQNQVSDNQPAPPPAQTGWVSPNAHRSKNLRIGGGGSSGQTTTAEPKQQTNTRNNRALGGNSNRNTNRNAAANETFDGGGLLNGFFPQPTDGGATFVSTGALSNGFYPQSLGNGGGSSSAPAAVKVSPASKLKKDAIAAFQSRNEADAFKYLYASILTSDENLEKYPIRWYAGLNQPRAAFRWGVGVIYTNKNDDETPLVIGDPTGTRENVKTRTSSRSGGSSGGRGSGSMEGPDDSRRGRRPGQSSNNSDYVNVDTENPEGFLLYYTGDFGDRLLTRLEARRTHEDAFYGEILREIKIDYSEESAQASPPPRRQQQRNNGRGRDNLSVGGGGNSGGGNVANRNVGNVNSGGGGDAESTSRLQRVSTSTTAVAPAADTTGTLIPGVMLVGEGSKDDLIERARNMDLDGLLIFKCQVSSGKKAVGMASVKLINLHASERKEQDVFTGRSLKSDRVAEKREDGVDEAKDPVELALDELFKGMADVKFKATVFPEGLKAHVEKRANAIVESNPSNKLAAVVEIMSFHQQNMLSDDVAKKTLSRLLGGVVGEVLIDGDADQRYEVLKRYLPNGSSTASGNNDSFR